jgi:uncharacterized protein (DUF1330 family)
MPAYVLAQSRVKDLEKYHQWVTGLLEVIENYGGRCLVGGGRVIPLNDTVIPERRQPDQFILLEFPAEVDLRRYRASPEYRRLSKLRQEAADTRIFLLEAYKPENL